MSWWSWIIFWVVFWTGALAYLAWRCWQVWPHARDFARTVSEARQRVERTRALAEEASKEVSTRRPAAVGEAGDGDDLAWNTPAAVWRARRRIEKDRQREVRLDDHAEVWRGWTRHVDS